MTTLFIIVLLLGAIGYFAYDRIIRWHEEGVETAKMELREEIKLPERQVVPREKLIEAFGEEATEVSVKEKEVNYEEIERQITAFFSYLDVQDYVRAYKLEEGTYQEFQRTVKELSLHLPIIAGETESLHTLFKNMSHFFRVLGIKRVNLVKDILKNESEITESVMKSFYLWFTMKADSGETIKGRPSLKVLYNYSGYFLHTLAGRSYLLRRELKVRTLTSYYCVLILDKANDLSLNSIGIDIRPHIKSLHGEFSSQRGFINREQYLSELEKLKGKYQL